MKRAVIALAVIAMGSSVSVADWKADIGFSLLQARLGAAAPTGLGIAVTQVEAKSGTAYFPDTSQPEFAGKTIIRASYGSGISSHATSVAGYYYGITGSIAPAINTVDVYESIDWLTSGSLNWTEWDEPYPETRRVQNHSWVGFRSVESDNIEILRRIDRVVERDGVVAAAAVNNGAGSAVPKLLGSAYNVLTVGLTSGNSSYGPTVIDLAGRVKPDLVVPASQTSWGTPMAASAAALLLQQEDQQGVLGSLDPSEQRLARALLAKALLMGGATKGEFADWRRGFATPTTDGTVPLDYRYGAGELNIDNSDRILTAGQQPAGNSGDVGTTGWDYAPAVPAVGRFYFFEIPAASCVKELSILVTWNRHIEFIFEEPLIITPTLANIDLALHHADDFTAGERIDQSISSIDNVEHIYLRHLPAGRYVFEITSDADWKYAVAWDVKLGAVVGVDFNGDGRVDQADLAYFAGCSGGANRPLPRPDCVSTDLDYDGDNDLNDFGRFQRCLTAPGAPPDPACSD